MGSEEGRVGGVLLPPRSGRNGRVEVLTSGERVHQSWVRVGGVSRLLFGLANLRVTFSKFQSDRLRHVGIKPYALLQNRPQKNNGGCDQMLSVPTNFFFFQEYNGTHHHLRSIYFNKFILKTMVTQVLSTKTSMELVWLSSTIVVV